MACNFKVSETTWLYFFCRGWRLGALAVLKWAGSGSIRWMIFSCGPSIANFDSFDGYGHEGMCVLDY